MVKSFIRIGMSVMLGAALALPFAAQVRAQEINDVSDILPTSFSDRTGLGQRDLKESLGELINVALGFLGIVAVIIILFGGFKWMTAGGNDEKVGEAKRLIIAGIIGVAIILSAYAITTFVLQSLIDATTTDSGI
ncbi:MAG: hypothetical protein WAZ14_01165 [Patescibacteria group bacterium]